MDFWDCWLISSAVTGLVLLFTVDFDSYADLDAPRWLTVSLAVFCMVVPPFYWWFFLKAVWDGIEED